MDAKKRAAFVAAHMARRPLNLARGGAVLRRMYDSGGTVNPIGSVTAPMAQTTTAGAGLSAIPAALTVQNGYQAGLAPTTQYNYGNVIGGAGTNALQGYGAEQTNEAQQNAVAQQLLAQSQGQGPNPYTEQLAATTGQNVAQQAALMAGQRGAGSNVGLIARQAAQQGAATQQQAAGQAATMTAQQELAQQQAAAGILGNVGSQGISEQNANTSLLTGGASANNSQNAGLVSNYGMAQGINSQVSQNNANSTNQTAGGIIGGIASALSLAKGGDVTPATLAPEDTSASYTTPELKGPSDKPSATQAALQNAGKGVKNYMQSAATNADATGIANSVSAPVDTAAPTLGSSTFGAAAAPAPSLLSGAQGGTPSLLGAGDAGGMASLLPALALAQGGHVAGHFHRYFAGGGKVPALVSAQEVYLNPSQVHEVLHRGADPMKIGHRFPGTDKVKGRNSTKNDTIPVDLDDGGCVIPIAVTTHKKASDKARAFVQRTMARK
jgi:hypothetical protein